MYSSSRQSRREFIKRTSALTAVGLASPWLLDLAALAGTSLSGVASTSAGSDDDYRALVCLFMSGGNDHYDLFVPNDSQGYSTYLSARGDLARSLDDVIELAPVGGFADSRSIGLSA